MFGKQKNHYEHKGYGITLDILSDSGKPVFLVGGGVNIARSGKEMTCLAELTGIPVITTIMGKGAIPTEHNLHVGNIGIHGSFAANSAISNCDVLFSIGTRFNDRITGKIETFTPHAQIIHIDIEPTTISRNVVADVPIVADAKKAICALLEKAKPLSVPEWVEQIRKSLWKEMFWSQSYCLISTGGVTVDIIKQYILSQGEKSDGK